MYNVRITGKCNVVMQANLKTDFIYFLLSLSFIRMKAQTLVDSLSELMVDASLGTIQCLEEIVSNSLHSCGSFLFMMVNYRNAIMQNIDGHGYTRHKMYNVNVCFI